MKYLRFSQQEWIILMEQSFERVRELAAVKGGEYSGDHDRLANFRRNAENLGLAYEQVWAVYAAKHWDAIMQYIKDLGSATGSSRERAEPLEGRCLDLIVYLLLFMAMLKEQSKPSKFFYMDDAPNVSPIPPYSPDDVIPF